MGLGHGVGCQVENPVPHLQILDHHVFSAQEAVSRIEGGVQQVQPVQLSKDHRVQQVVSRDRVPYVRPFDLFEASQRAFVIQVVEVQKGFAHLRGAVERCSGDLCFAADSDK